MARLRLSLILFLVCALVVPCWAGSEPAEHRPRLVVLLIFDQLRGDFPGRWSAHFGPDGFKRLQAEGAWFTNCHYPYANTVTAAGHTSLVTGCSPNKHGVIGNAWYDSGTKRPVDAVADDKYRQLPMPANLLKVTKPLGVSPRQRLQPTVADVLKHATKGKAKVVALSNKPRSASLLASLLADCVYWFSDLTGGFVTSTFYRDEQHSWAARFNAEHLPDQWFGKSWMRARPTLDYDTIVGPDEALGESKVLGFGRSFPHQITGGLKKPGPDFYDAFSATPMANDLLVRFAKKAIDEEKLGQGETPDLLMLSFSANDLIGHLYGPDSHEVLDVTLRTDALIADFLHHLDAKIGKGRYAVVVSADHGICPLPEAARKQGKDSGRILPLKLRLAAEVFLQETFGASDRDYVEQFVSPWFYLDRKTLALRKVEPAIAERKLADWLGKQPGLQGGLTRTELGKGMPKDKIEQTVWRSFHPDRCGDVCLVARPYYLVTPYPAGTTHGSPYDYDTHVPLMVLGNGVRPGAHGESVTPQAAAAILAKLLGIDPPAGAEAPLPKVFGK